MEVNTSLMYKNISLPCSIHTWKIKACVFQVSFSHWENEKRKVMELNFVWITWDFFRAFSVDVTWFQLDELSSLFLNDVFWGQPNCGSADSCSSQVVQVVAGAREQPHPTGSSGSRGSPQLRLHLARHCSSRPYENPSKWFRLRKTGFHILKRGFTGMHTWMCPTN